MRLRRGSHRIRVVARAAAFRMRVSAATMRVGVAAAYIRLQAVTGRFVKFLTRNSPVSATSVFSFFLGRGFSDAFSAGDDTSVGPNKARESAASLTDGLEPFQIGKGLTENPKIGDSDYFAEDYTDPGYTITSYKMLFGKGLDEPIPVQDVYQAALQRGFVDGVDIVDAVLVRFLIKRQFADAAETTDVIVAQSGPAATSGTGLADGHVSGIEKALVDLAAAADALRAAHATERSSAAQATDTVVSTPKLGIMSAAGVADGGTMFLQDYAEPGYFAEDYVGTSQSF